MSSKTVNQALISEEETINQAPKLTDFPKNRDNPFLVEVLDDIEPIKRRKRISPNNREVTQSIINNDGQVVAQSAFTQFVEVDDKQFAKLFISNMAAFWELSRPAMRVFTYIMTIVKPDRDTFDFMIDDCMEYCKYGSKKPIFQGLADLLAKEIIARGRTQWQYFINPLIAFNGDRVVFAKGIIRKKIQREATEEQLNLWGDTSNSDLARLKKLHSQLENPEKIKQIEAENEHSAS